MKRDLIMSQQQKSMIGDDNAKNNTYVKLVAELEGENKYLKEQNYSLTKDISKSTENKLELDGIKHLLDKKKIEEKEWKQQINEYQAENEQ